MILIFCGIIASEYEMRLPQQQRGQTPMGQSQLIMK